MRIFKQLYHIPELVCYALTVNVFNQTIDEIRLSTHPLRKMAPFMTRYCNLSAKKYPECNEENKLPRSIPILADRHPSIIFLNICWSLHEVLLLGR
jgi:hypothetical protein